MEIKTAFQDLNPLLINMKRPILKTLKTSLGKCQMLLIKICLKKISLQNKVKLQIQETKNSKAPSKK